MTIWKLLGRATPLVACSVLLAGSAAAQPTQTPKPPTPDIDLNASTSPPTEVGDAAPTVGDDPACCTTDHKTMHHKLAAVIDCSAFVHNSDGSWSPTRTVSFRGVTMGAGVRFNPGVQMGGIDPAAELNQHCVP